MNWYKIYKLSQSSPYIYGYWLDPLGKKHIVIDHMSHLEMVNDLLKLHNKPPVQYPSYNDVMTLGYIRIISPIFNNYFNRIETNIDFDSFITQAQYSILSQIIAQTAKLQRSYPEASKIDIRIDIGTDAKNFEKPNDAIQFLKNFVNDEMVLRNFTSNYQYNINNAEAVQ